MTSKTTRRVPVWLRVLLPAVLILVWLTLAGVGGPYFGKVDEVSSNDPTAYLPTTAEATEVQTRLAEFSGSDAVPAILVFVSDTALNADQKDAIGSAVTAIGKLPEVDGDVSPPIVSDDGKAAQAFVPIAADADLGDAVEAIRADLDSDAIDGVAAYVTGPAGFSADLVQAFSGIDGLLLGVALGAVLVILIIVYRSPLLPLAVLLTSVSALTAALFAVWWLAKSGAVLLSGQTQGILFILVIGAATDYALLYVSRYREALRQRESRWEATWLALRGSFEPILASGGTVIAGLLCLLLSELQSNRALGPIAAIGIVFAMLAAFTFLPALLLALGRVAFWPRRPRVDEEGESGWEPPTSGLWARIPRFVRRRARPVWIVSVVLLLAASAGVLQLKADGVADSELILGASQARDGQQALGEHFPGGSGSPVYVLADESDWTAAADTLRDQDEIDAVSIVTADLPMGSAPVTADGIVSPIPGVDPTPTVVDGSVLLEGTLSVAADSTAAEEVVRQLRADLDGTALVGGVTAVALDSDDASIHDRNLIIPLVLVVITLILALLLRSIVAPLVLIGTVVLSFVATLGVSALVFNHVFDMPGADPAVPLFGFVFLVALGVDYNIFLMTRVREEALRHGAQAGIDRGLAITGGVITSAGLVLAATFAALAVLPILFLVQLAFIVAFGVLLDTLVVRTLLVPALAHEFGRALWWPSRRIGA